MALDRCCGRMIMICKLVRSERAAGGGARARPEMCPWQEGQRQIERTRTRMRTREAMCTTRQSGTNRFVQGAGVQVCEAKVQRRSCSYILAAEAVQCCAARSCATRAARLEWSEGRVCTALCGAWMSGLERGERLRAAARAPPAWRCTCVPWRVYVRACAVRA